MRPLPSVAEAQFGAFTAAQAMAEGWTASALRHAVSIGRIERPRPGVYVVPADDPATHLASTAAAFSLTNPRVPVCGASAAAVLGVHLLHVPEHVCANYPRERRGPMTGVHRHRGRLGRSDLGRFGCVRLTSPARAVFGVGHEHGGDAAVVAADSALRAGIVTEARLAAVVAATEGWARTRATRRALAIADAAAESPLESISRLRMLDLGVPAPRTQPRILGMSGIFLGRPDFYWDEFGVIGEADGMVKYDGIADSLVAEKKRQGRLEDAGLIVVRWDWSELRTFDAVAARLAAAFARGMRPDRAPRRWRVAAGPHARVAS